MRTTTALSPRRVAASASLGVAAVTLGAVALRVHDTGAARLGLAGVALLTAGSALGLARRAVLPQVLSRGMPWLIAAVTGVACFAELSNGRAPEPVLALLAASSSASLWFARAGLASREARAEFAPIVYRGWFLAGSIAAVVAGILVAGSAVATLAWGGAWGAVGLAGLAAVLFGAAWGVVRMRAWGVLLGGVTAAGLLGAGYAAHDEALGVILALGALPGVLLVAPVLAARWLVAPKTVSPALAGPRLASELDRDAWHEAEPHAARTRVAALDATPDTREDEEDARPARAAARAR